MTEHRIPIPFDMIPQPGKTLSTITFIDLMTHLLHLAHGMSMICQHGIVDAANDDPDHGTRLRAALMLQSDVLGLACSTLRQWSNDRPRQVHPKTPNGAETTA